jgi:hypothetical protein
MAATIQCPECGAAMNHHADKLVEPTSAADAATVTSGFGGMVAEVHSCPGCGAVEMRLN